MRQLQPTKGDGSSDVRWHNCWSNAAPGLIDEQFAHDFETGEGGADSTQRGTVRGPGIVDENGTATPVQSARYRYLARSSASPSRNVVQMVTASANIVTLTSHPLENVVS